MDAPLHVSRWLNAPAPIMLESLRGRIVALLTFQMLCPGCVAHALPQLQRVQATFRPEDVAVLALHTVFEHHAAMTPVALEAFAHEYRLDFPIGIDVPDPAGGAIPRTMSEWGFQGTPTLLLFDHRGNLRLNHFGHIEDLALGGILGQLIADMRADAAGVHDAGHLAPSTPAAQAAGAARCRPASDPSRDEGSAHDATCD